MKISFSLFYLYENTGVFEKYRNLSPEIFQKFPQKEFIPSDENKKNPCRELISQLTDDYFWIDLSYGTSTPKNDQLTNVYSGEKTDNPRKLDQAELNNKVYFMYFLKSNIAYISDSRRIDMILHILNEKLETIILQKCIYKDLDEFLDVIQEVDSISFTEMRNLFHPNGTKSKALVDLTGTDAPDSFTIQAKYSTHNIQRFVRELNKGYKDNGLKKLIVKGRDSHGLEMLFNTDYISHKIEINVTSDDPESVKHELRKVVLHEK